MDGPGSSISPETYTDICDFIALGNSARKGCEKYNVPISTFIAKTQQPDFSDQYARSIVSKLEVHADELVDIADDGYEVDRSRLRVDTRKWILSRLLPKKFGDKSAMELTGKDGAEIKLTYSVKGIDDKPINI